MNMEIRPETLLRGGFSFLWIQVDESIIEFLGHRWFQLVLVVLLREVCQRAWIEQLSLFIKNMNSTNYFSWNFQMGNSDISMVFGTENISVIFRMVVYCFRKNDQKRTELIFLLEHKQFFLAKLESDLSLSDQLIFHPRIEFPINIVNSTDPIYSYCW